MCVVYISLSLYVYIYMYKYIYIYIYTLYYHYMSIYVCFSLGCIQDEQCKNAAHLLLILDASKMSNVRMRLMFCQS